ncbi:MAG: ribonuclease P protein component [Clostridiales bacterium]|nr:ribonuclease P protein component [Clostridiales bacterium]
MRKPDVLRNKKDFSSIYNNGKSVGERCLVLFYKKNGLLYNRRAFLASKKVGKSVLRNRARRLLRESYRYLENDIKKGYDLIFIARKSILKLKCADVKESMEAALKKARILEKK